MIEILSKFLSNEIFIGIIIGIVPSLTLFLIAKPSILNLFHNYARVELGENVGNTVGDDLILFKSSYVIKNGHSSDPLKYHQVFVEFKDKTIKGLDFNPTGIVSALHPEKGKLTLYRQNLQVEHTLTQEFVLDNTDLLAELNKRGGFRYRIGINTNTYGLVASKWSTFCWNSKFNRIPNAIARLLDHPKQIMTARIIIVVLLVTLFATFYAVRMQKLQNNEETFNSLLNTFRAHAELILYIDPNSKEFGGPQAFQQILQSIDSLNERDLVYSLGDSMTGRVASPNTYSYTTRGNRFDQQIENSKHTVLMYLMSLDVLLLYIINNELPKDKEYYMEAIRSKMAEGEIRFLNRIPGNTNSLANRLYATKAAAIVEQLSVEAKD